MFLLVTAVPVVFNTFVFVFVALGLLVSLHHRSYTFSVRRGRKDGGAATKHGYEGTEACIALLSFVHEPLRKVVQPGLFFGVSLSVSVLSNATASESLLAGV